MSLGFYVRFRNDHHDSYDVPKSLGQQTGCCRGGVVQRLSRCVL